MNRQRGLALSGLIVWGVVISLVAMRIRYTGLSKKC